MATATKQNTKVSMDLFMPEALAKIPNLTDLESFLRITGFGSFRVGSLYRYSVQCGHLYRFDDNGNSLDLSHVE